MKKTAIIGLGTVTKYYLEGLKASQVLELCAVCDANPDAVSRDTYKDYPFYTDYKKMIKEAGIETVIISTPPATHFEVATYALEHGVQVICEKPVVLSLEEYEKLLKTARDNAAELCSMYHWQTGEEILYFNEHYDAKKIEEIHATVLDPYSEDGVTIDGLKQKLQGTWIDTGVNILSMIKTWLPFETLEIKSLDKQICPASNLPIYIKADLIIDGVPAYITVDWRQHINKKESYLLYDGRRIDIKHSAQTIEENGQSVNLEKMERMQRHYYNYFTRFNGNTDEEGSMRIHKVLLEVNAKI